MAAVAERDRRLFRRSQRRDQGGRGHLHAARTRRHRHRARRNNRPGLFAKMRSGPDVTRALIVVTTNVGELDRTMDNPAPHHEKRLRTAGHMADVGVACRVIQAIPVAWPFQDARKGPLIHASDRPFPRLDLFATGAIVFVIGAVSRRALVIYKFEQGSAGLYAALQELRAAGDDARPCRRRFDPRRIFARAPSVSAVVTAIPALVKEAFIAAEDKNFLYP